MEEAPPEEKKEDSGERTLVHTYALVKHCDMPEEVRSETTELVVNACEKYQSDNGMAARLIKDTLDAKFGPAWHVVVGEGFGFEIEYESKTIMFMYFSGNLAACIWKCP